MTSLLVAAASWDKLSNCSTEKGMNALECSSRHRVTQLIKLRIVIS